MMRGSVILVLGTVKHKGTFIGFLRVDNGVCLTNDNF